MPTQTYYLMARTLFGPWLPCAALSGIDPTAEFRVAPAADGKTYLASRPRGSSGAFDAIVSLDGVQEGMEIRLTRRDAVEFPPQPSVQVNVTGGVVT